MRGVGRGVNAGAKCGDKKGQAGMGEDAEPLVLFGRVPSIDRARKLVKVSDFMAQTALSACRVRGVANLPNEVSVKSIAT